MTRSGAFSFLAARCYDFFSPLQPAIHYIFFVIANGGKFFDPHYHRNYKKGCRSYRGYVEVFYYLSRMIVVDIFEF
ncbi:MAG: hypothetical protein KA796_06075 [Chryseobacterium sp.]|nr:hypothetical protein [Chryseobacterium sp.]MBP7499420.1 hypothetical protein [Chryseobacterium sp.]